MKHLRPLLVLSLLGITLTLTGCGGSGSASTSPSGPVTPQSPPTLSNISATSGNASGGDYVTLTGTNLSNATVSFGNSEATVTYPGSTNLTVATPAHANGTVDVTVVTPYGTSTLPNAYSFESQPNPVSISPSFGTTAGGTLVTISGTGFTGTTAVEFDGTPATDIHVVNDSEITAFTPAHASGYVRFISVANGIGLNSLEYAYNYIAPGTASMTMSPDSITMPAYNGSQITFTNTSDYPITNLSATESPGLLGILSNFDCGTTIYPHETCDYKIYGDGVYSGTVHFTATGQDLQQTALSETATITTTPISGVIVEMPSADISDNSSVFMQNTDAASTLNTVFLNVGALNFNYLSEHFSASSTCSNPDAFFTFFAPAALSASCVNFDQLTSDYQKANPELKTVVWLGTSSDPSSITPVQLTAGNIGFGIDLDPDASGVAIDSSTLFSNPNITDLSNFYIQLAQTLKEESKTLYLYNAPWSELPAATLTGLKNLHNVVALVPLYNLDGTNSDRTAIYSGAGNYSELLTTAVQTPIDSGNPYGGLPFVFVAPAAGSMGNWQALLLYKGGSSDPYHDETPPTGVDSSSCTLDPSAPDCSAYLNEQTPFAPTAPTGYAPEDPQMFAYTQAALCAVSDNTAVLTSHGYSGMVYHSVRPAGYWASQHNSAVNAEYPESIGDTRWEMLKAWTNTGTRHTICD